jgi:hypothetical protein
MITTAADAPALVKAVAIGSILQLAMVIGGHYEPGIAQLFGILGVTISLVAGMLYAVFAASPTIGAAAWGGLLAGGTCALIGILVSFGLGDVGAIVVAFGTISSAVTGALGGLLGRWLSRGAMRRAG